jgi:AAA domain/CHC2 zinc finger/Homeodomain-like domain
MLVRVVGCYYPDDSTVHAADIVLGRPADGGDRKIIQQARTMKNAINNFFSDGYDAFYGKYLPQLRHLGGDEYQSLCPFHRDQNPSLSINAKTGQYYCHGCGKKGDIFHFYGKLNSLRTGPGFGKILHGISSDFGIKVQSVKPRLVATYPYFDENGQELFQVCRMEPKNFWQRHRNGNGKWTWNLKGVRRVLYNLPEILKANEVVIVEGEKDVNNLAKLGITATTSPMGAGKWLDSYNKHLKGKDIVLIPDNDNQGREHMAKIGASLEGDAKSIRWLNIPGLPSKGDVSDFIATHPDSEDAAERFAVMLENAEPYSPPKQLSHDDAVMTVKDFVNIDIPERAEFLTPWLKEDSIGLLAGERGLGKTFFAIGALDAVSRGTNFGNWECRRPAPVLFLDGEMPPGDIQERIEGLGLNVDRECPFYLYSDAWANQNGLARAHLASETWRKKMKRILIARKVKFWVIDNLASLAPGLDENKKQDWDPINQWLLELRFSGIATLMLHHTGKGGGQRGTSAREDNLDYSIILKSPPNYVPEDGARFIVHFSKARVSTKNLQAIADTEFRLTADDSGAYAWTYGSVKKERRLEVLRMLDDGMKQNEISEILGISKGQVSKIRSKAIKDSYLSAKNTLTQTGFLEVSSG